jgi:RND family efflux transporter MFP subunit
MEPTFTPPAPTSSRRGPLTVVVGIVLLVALFIYGLMPKLRNDTKLATDAKSVATEVPEVELAKPRMAAAGPLLLPGNIQALSEATIQARTSGYIRKLYVDIGSHVKAGQVLADIESPDADQQVAQANADTAKSRATVGQSVADVARSQAGVSQSQADVIRQGAAVKQAEAAAAGARSKLAQARADKSQADAKVATARQAVDVQKANLAQAQAQYDLAVATVKRYEGLLKEGFVAQQDYDQAAATYKTAAATVQSAKANIQASQSDVTAAEQTVQAESALVESAQSDIAAADENIRAAQASYHSVQATVNAAQAGVQASRANVVANQAAVQSSIANAQRYNVLSSFEHVVAPFDGVITSRNVDIGSLVSPGATMSANANSATPGVGLFGLARDDTLRIYVNVPQSDFQAVRPGTVAKVVIPEIPKRTFDGTVFQASGAFDATTRTRLTEIRLANPSHILLPGMYAQVSITSPDARTSLRVPSDALIIDADGTRVVVVGEDDRVHFRKILIGRDYGTEAEILTGLSPTDRLIANPSDELQEGGKVRIVSSAAGAAVTK